MTDVNSSSESTGPRAASSSSRGALASIAASEIIVSRLTFFDRGGAYFVVWLGFSFGRL